MPDNEIVGRAGKFFGGEKLNSKKRTSVGSSEKERPCPYRKPKTADWRSRSVDTPIDERSLQIDLVRLDRAAGRRHQLNVPQIPEASSAQQNRLAMACWDSSPRYRGAGRPNLLRRGPAPTALNRFK
jgi:hypothetical protein